MGAPAARAVELARHWVQAGHEVTILTGFPNHPTGVVPPEWRSRLRHLVYREDVDGIRVVRTWLWPLPNRKAHERMLNYSSFCVSAAFRGMEISRPDVVIATSPQLLVGISGWWIARWARTPFVFEVRDLWPESLSAVGVGNEKSFLHRLLKAVASFLYRKSNHIVVVTPAFKDYLTRHWDIPQSKISVVENGVETDLFAPREQTALRASLAVEEKFVVSYVGTMGMAHGLETLVNAAAVLQSARPDVVFLLVGEGADKERIKALVEQRGLHNVRFVDQQPREVIPDFIAASDACLVLLKKTDLFKTVIPTKMLEFMSCGRPVILGVEGQARQILQEANGGIAIEPENVEGLVNAVTALADDPQGRAQMGSKARKYIVERYSREKTAKEYVTVLEELLGRKLAPRIQEVI